MTAKKLSVELLERIANIGKPGDILEVSHPYAHNFLLPKKLARLVTPELMKQRELETKRRLAAKMDTIEQKRAAAEKLHMKSLAFDVEGHGSKVFGGIDEHALIERIRKDYGVELEKKYIIMPDGKHLKKVWVHDIKIDLGHEVYIRMSVELRLKGK